MVIVKTYAELLAERDKLLRQYLETLFQTRRDQVFIPEVRKSVLRQIQSEIGANQSKISARDKLLRREHIFEKAIQLPFEFIFDCSIRDDEIPF